VIIPYATDAPVYHWPYATVGTIIANVLAYFFAVSLPEEPQKLVVSWLVLTFGNFNPIAWITWNYLHADIFHLIGNMMFLWVFGLIVEGKVGPWRFLVIYNLIGFVAGGIIQILTIFFSEGGALGASGAIFGLMAIAMFWAPANTIHCVFLFGIRTSGALEVPAYSFVGFFLILQFAFASFAAINAASAGDALSAITSETLHLAGAVAGAPIGFYMLKAKMVDCEGWDVFSVWQGKHTRTKEQVAEEYLNSEEGKAKIQSAKDELTNLIRQYLANDGTIAAWAAYKRGLNQFPGFRLPENDLLALIGAMRKAGMWDETISLMVVFLRQYPERDSAVRLGLAQIMLEKKSRGLQAFKVLQKIDKRKLDPRHLPVYERFIDQAQAMANDDPYEVASEDW
jgi:membrane associated rhomboid family serine protease